MHRFEGRAEKLVLSELVGIVMVDETAVNFSSRQLWLWLTIELEHKAVLALMLTEARNVLIAYSLFTCLRRHEVRHIITGNVSWYRIAAGWTRLRHSVVRGGMRSYIERFIETIKDRFRGFDCYFPSPKKMLSSALQLIYAWAYFYNYTRVHLSFRRPPKPLQGVNRLERLKAIAIKGVIKLVAPTL
ncbi:MAG: hypothetical protein B6U94_03325 [Thermofilum sp. ex4484_79]|nr:MAG: hypothetical protein B6U94_03325 [Thermofilum sp. ex4484_79]